MATPGKSGSKLSKEIEISPYNLTEGMLAKLNISNVLSSIVQLNPQEAETAGTSNSSSADRSDSATEPGGASASAAQSGSHKLPLEAVDFVAMRKEVMILASFGDHFPEVDAVAKMKDNAERMNEECSPLNIELQLIQDMVNESETHSMKYVMVDFPGNQCTRDYYLKRIEHFFANCNKDAGKCFACKKNKCMHLLNFFSYVVVHWCSREGHRQLVLQGWSHHLPRCV